MPVKIAVVGFGHAARERSSPELISLASESKIELTAIIELDEERREQAMRSLGFKHAFTTIEDCLQKVKLDGALVLTASNHHFTPTIQFLKAGVATCMEKPISYSLSKAQEIARVSKKTGVMCMVLENRRYMPVITQAKEFLGDSPVEFCFAEKSKNIPAKYNKLLDNGVHPLGAMLHLAGKPSQILKSTLVPNKTFAAMLKFQSGGIGFFLQNCHPGGWVERYEVHAKNKSVYIDDCSRLRLYKDNRETIAGPLVNKWWNIDPFGFGAEIRHFVLCIEKQEVSPISDISICLEAQELYQEMAIQAGLKSG